MPFDGTVISQAAEAITLLDRVKSYFQRGKYWMRGQLRQGKRRCILGALEDAAIASRIHSGSTVYYLLCAINPHWKHAKDQPSPWLKVIMDFNDEKAQSYGDVRKLLCLARHYAEQDARC